MKNFKLLMLFVLTLAALGILCVGVSAENIEEIEPNNTILTATQISVGDAALGVLSDDGDSDYYEFTVTEYGYIKLMFSNVISNAYDPAWKLNVIKYTDTYEEIHTSFARGEKTMTETLKIGVEPGTYYIEVINGGYEGSVNGIEYGIKVFFDTQGHWETEENNSFSYADEMELNSEYGGYIMKSGDVDYYTVQISEKGYIQLIFTNYYIFDYGKWELTLYKMDGIYEEIYRREYNSEDSVTRSPRIGVEPGTYYIKIVDSSYGDYAVGYQYGIMAGFTPNEYWESENNGDYAVADHIELGYTYSGFVGSDADVDCYELDLSEDCDITFNFSNAEEENHHYAGWNVDLYEYNDSYENIYSKQFSVSGNTHNEKIKLTSGKYYFKITCYSDEYDYTVFDVEYNISVAKTQTKKFSDVKDSHWFAESVSFVVLKGYMNGMSETTFVPNGNIKREQFVLILANIAGVDTNEYKYMSSGMSDVPTGMWYSGAVTWAVNEGYVSGMTPTTFGIGKDITRAQLARLFYVYAEQNDIDVYGRADLSHFADSQKVQDWMRDGLEWAVDAGIISGMEINGKLSLNPNGTATRAQVAVMLMKFDALID